MRNIKDISDGWDDGGSDPAVSSIFKPQLGSKAVNIQVNGSAASQYWEWDVTDLVKETGAGLDNNVMSFRMDMGGGVFRFNGRNGSPVAGHAPQLVVTTVPEPGSLAMLAPLTLALLIRRNHSRLRQVF